MIDERAVIHPSAKIADDVTIGPWTMIGPDVEIDSGTWVGPHVVINGPTKIGKNNKIFQFASVGEEPQDKKYDGEKTWLIIGDGNTIREYCTLNRGTVQGGGKTVIGNNNLLMAYVHIAHDCIVHDNTIFANNASLAGHVEVFNHAILSGFSGIHQFCKVGQHSFIAKNALVTKDVLPYMLVAGIEKPATYGLNAEGLRRHGFSQEVIQKLRRAYKVIYRKGLKVEDVIKELEHMSESGDNIDSMIDFLKTSERGIV